MANVIDVDFVEIHPPKSGDEILREIEAEVDRAHRSSMRAIFAIPAVALSFTVGLWAYAVAIEAWVK